MPGRIASTIARETSTGAFFPGTPVAVLHASADGRWRFVVGATYAAWIPDGALAHTDRDTALGFAHIAGESDILL